MKITLLNGALGTSSSPKLAFPGMNGLYGKNPTAKMQIATGIKIFAMTIATADCGEPIAKDALLIQLRRAE